MTTSGRVVVTGLGAVSALGLDYESNWQAVRDGRGGIAMATIDPGEHGPPPHTLPLALVDPSLEDVLEAELNHKVASLDRAVVYGLKAALEALKHAGLAGHPAVEHRTAIVFGRGNGGSHSLETAYQRFYGLKNPRLHPLTVPRVMVSAAVSAISMEFGIKGPAFAVSSACSSSGHAIAQGAMMIRSGLADVVISGGCEAIASAGTMRAWEAAQAISKTTCRPFSRGRDGTVIGEGAAGIILESFEHATARGAAIHGELLGIGMSSDAHHWTQPTREGALTAMNGACDNARLAGTEVLVSAHGTGTVLNDKNEADAIRTVMGERDCRYDVIATKSAHGHLIGASTALQAILGLRALREGLAPPILNHLEADPDCDVNIVLGEAKPIAARTLLVNAFAFGGLNTALVFGV